MISGTWLKQIQTNVQFPCAPLVPLSSVSRRDSYFDVKLGCLCGLMLMVNTSCFLLIHVVSPIHLLFHRDRDHTECSVVLGGICKVAFILSESRGCSLCRKVAGAPLQHCRADGHLLLIIIPEPFHTAVAAFPTSPAKAVFCDS